MQRDPTQFGGLNSGRNWMASSTYNLRGKSFAVLGPSATTEKPEEPEKPEELSVTLPGTPETPATTMTDQGEQATIGPADDAIRATIAQTNKLLQTHLSNIDNAHVRNDHSSAVKIVNSLCV